MSYWKEEGLRAKLARRGADQRVPAKQWSHKKKRNRGPWLVLCASFFRFERDEFGFWVWSHQETEERARRITNRSRGYLQLYYCHEDTYKSLRALDKRLRGV